MKDPQRYRALEGCRLRFITLLGGAAAVVSLTRPRFCAADRGTDMQCAVPQAIGQSFDWLVPAEAEVVGARGGRRKHWGYEATNGAGPTAFRRCGSVIVWVSMC